MSSTLAWYFSVQASCSAVRPRASARASNFTRQSLPSNPLKEYVGAISESFSPMLSS